MTSRTCHLMTSLLTDMGPMYKSASWYEPDDSPEKWGVCDGCGEDIYEGDHYYLVMDLILCEPCIAECRHEAENDRYDD